MAKNKSSFEGQELAPMEPWRPEYAPQAIASRRHPASTIVAFVLAAGFGLSIGGAFAREAGILPPLGGTESAAVVDQVVARCRRGRRRRLIASRLTTTSRRNSLAGRLRRLCVYRSLLCILQQCQQHPSDLQHDTHGSAPHSAPSPSRNHRHSPNSQAVHPPL